MDDFTLPRTLGRGRTYVYLLPCREQDLVKLGFSRQPLVRMRSLHQRFFEVFDLERGLLLETDRLAVARRVERELIQHFGAERSPAPLTVAAQAGGYSEWFRGVFPEASAMLAKVAEREGFPLHPLQAWVRDMFLAQADALYEWSLRMLDAMEYETFNVPAEWQRHTARESLRYVMDACEAVGVALPAHFPEPAVSWRRDH